MVGLLSFVVYRAWTNCLAAATYISADDIYGFSVMPHSSMVLVGGKRCGGDDESEGLIMRGRREERTWWLLRVVCFCVEGRENKNPKVLGYARYIP